MDLIQAQGGLIGYSPFFSDQIMYSYETRFLMLRKRVSGNVL